MSIVVETFLICDGCGNTFGVDMKHRCGLEHRNVAKQEGWKTVPPKDYCEVCVSNLKSWAAVGLPKKLGRRWKELKSKK